jgi:hypothetical protein
MVVAYVGFSRSGIGEIIMPPVLFATKYRLRDIVYPTWSLYQCQASSFIGSPTEPITLRCLICIFVRNLNSLCQSTNSGYAVELCYFMFNNNFPKRL